ncbi:MAG: hypothetical protein ABI863_10455 [Ginsengibacter sp.]
MAVRILTQVNYSAGNNPEGDSGLYFLSKLLRSLVNLNSDFHFYVLIPKKHEVIWTRSLSHKRITAIPMKLEPRLHGGGFMFDPSELYGAFDFLRFDIDILFLNQPETTPAICNFLNRQMFHCLPSVSYVHWFDTRPSGTPKKEMYKLAIMGVLAGIMVSDAVGVNSSYGKIQILKQAKKWFNDSSIENLSNRIHLLPPGIDRSDINIAIKKRKQQKRARLIRIVLNHRLLNYTGVRNLVATTFPQVWSLRHDFRVFATNPSMAILPGSITKQPWLTVQTLEKPDYLNLLGQCDIVVAPHKNAHWSISTLEAISAGCIPLMNKESFFIEMLEPALQKLPASVKKHIMERWFYHRGNLTSKLLGIMDNIKEERQLSIEFSKTVLTIYNWKGNARNWEKLLLETDSKTYLMPELTPSMRKIFLMLLARKEVSKIEILRHLDWRPKQRTLSWTSFRKTLLRFTHEDANRPDSVYKLRKECKQYLLDLVKNTPLRN